jgi:hypothetical protein
MSEKKSIEVTVQGYSPEKALEAAMKQAPDGNIPITFKVVEFRVSKNGFAGPQAFVKIEQI